MGSDDTTLGPAETTPGRLALVLWKGDEPEVHTLEPGRALILGRATPADLVVDVPTLSREHVRIAPSAAGVTITDLGSKNGVRVGGERVSSAELRPGDAFEAGGVHALVTPVLPARRLDAHHVHRAALLEAIESELARFRITQRAFAVAAIELAGDAPARLRPLDRAAVFAPGVVCALLPELEIDDARALLSSRLPGARAGLASPRSGHTASALIEAARRALATTTATQRSAVAASEPDEDAAPIVASPRMRDVFALADRFAASDRPVLVLGETGVGKELVSQRIHASSRRRQGPLRVLNCGAIPASLVESTLFGYERGAFTGAAQRTRGAFEEASGGTLFLDEIGELALPAQAALLRVLETGRFSRVGSTEEISADVRVVAATHADLGKAAEEGRFRSDLLHRLRVLVVEVPPLRERPEDVVALAHAFVRRACEAAAREPLVLDASSVASLLAHDWPGNVRELRNVIERAVLLSTGPAVTIADLADGVRPPPPAPAPPALDGGWSLRARLEAFEAELIVAALDACGGNQVAAAKLLELPRRTLVHKISRLGLRKRWERGSGE